MITRWEAWYTPENLDRDKRILAAPPSQSAENAASAFQVEGKRRILDLACGIGVAAGLSPAAIGARSCTIGPPLPPVDLVQVRDLYLVQDGHHRISVARALGHSAIEARVKKQL